MANAFDSTNYPTVEPLIIYAGDRVMWKRTDLATDYPIADYALSYSARLESDQSRLILISATESGSEYLVEVAHTTTNTWPVGRYQWTAYITRSSDSARIAIGDGMFEVKANRASASTDPRTHARKVLTNIETAIEALSTKTASSYTIMGRQMTYADLPELNKLRKEYMAEVSAEDRKANGRGGSKVVVKLRR